MHLDVRHTKMLYNYFYDCELILFYFLYMTFLTCKKKKHTLYTPKVECFVSISEEFGQMCDQRACPKILDDCIVVPYIGPYLGNNNRKTTPFQ